MTNNITESFTVPELYLLGSAFGGNVIFGLPEKQIYQLKGEEIFADAYHRLIKKGILGSDGEITKGGSIIIRALEYYYRSEKYVRINNLMFAFPTHNEDELIMFVETKEQAIYKLFVISKALILKLLSDKFSIITREPEESEKHFLKQELTYEERREAEQLEPGNTLINLELFHLNEKHQELHFSSYYQQWLVFPKKEKLIMVDTVQRKYYHASQYWFLKLLFDEMEFPYKEAT